MKRRLLSALALCVLAAPAFGAKTAPEEQFIRELVGRFAEAFNRHDTKTMASFWAEDATLVNAQGKRASGRKEIQKSFEDDHAGVFKGASGELSVDTFRFRGGFAFVDVSMTLTGAVDAEGKPRPAQKYQIAALMTRMGKGWSWLDARVYQN